MSCCACRVHYCIILCYTSTRIKQVIKWQVWDHSNEELCNLLYSTLLLVIVNQIRQITIKINTTIEFEDS